MFTGIVSEEGRYWNHLCNLLHAYQQVREQKRIDEEVADEIESKIGEIESEIKRLSELHAVMIP
jgi:hypothetical protein